MEFPKDYNHILNTSSFIHHSKSVICFTLDYDGNVGFKNEAYKNILGYTEENIRKNIINPKFETLIADKSSELVYDGIITLSRGVSSSSFESKVFKNEELLLFICEYNSSEIEDLYKKMSSNSLKINNMNRDLIKAEFTLKNTIQELKETQAMLIHSEKMNALGQLVAGIAHEINNPIAYVISNIQLLDGYFSSMKKFIEDLDTNHLNELDALKEKYDVEYILSDFASLNEATLHGANRVSKIVNELRDYSRIDSSQLILCNIEDCLNDALSIASPEIKNKRIDLVLNFETTPDIECYPAQLNQAFLNIIINAIQAVEEEGKLSISLFEKESSIQIEIEDNGCGIAEENLSKIYDAFYTTKPPGKGVGIGLNIVYKIVKDIHHGEITVSSILNKGTKFILTLPKV